MNEISTSKYLWRKVRYMSRKKLLFLTVTAILIFINTFYKLLFSSGIGSNKLVFVKVPSRTLNDPLIRLYKSKQAEMLSSNLQISYKMTGYHIHENKHYAIVTIKNTGNTPISLEGLSLYFCSVQLLYPSQTKDLKLEHVNGCLHKIEPVLNSGNDGGSTGEIVILPKTSMHFDYKGRYVIALRTQIMPNWFILNNTNGEISVLKNTVGEKLKFVENFTVPAQWKTDLRENFHPYTPLERYKVIGFDGAEGQRELPLVVPQPLRIIDLDKRQTVKVDGSWRVLCERSLEKAAMMLKETFQIPVEYQSSPSKQPKTIILSTGDIGFKMENESIEKSNEAYVLRVKPSDQYIEVIGGSPAGGFYGVQTLLSLKDKMGTIPMVTIQDAPKLAYRGMHLDVSRNFFSKETVFRLLEVMAMYKMNKFHFHLTDDEGWRIEIPGLPELTQIGSKRCYDPTGLKCIGPLLGSNPHESTIATYYTVQEYKDILKYANDRFIEVIPEIDFPGHCYAAMQAMKARYEVLKAQGKHSEANEFLLNEFEDKSVYQSIQMYNNNTLNPCLESTYRFATHIMTELVKMHKDIQPLKTYHFGGDEVPKNVWKESSACSKIFGASLPYETIRDKIKEYFVKRMVDIASSLGVQVAGWDDFFSVYQKASALSAQDIIVTSWNDVAAENGNGVNVRVYLMAQNGYKVVFNPATRVYFDHAQEPDPEERGNFWATTYTDTRKVFKSIPNFCRVSKVCKAEKGMNKVYGISGCLWSEVVRTTEQLHYMIFPRLLSLAERAWHKASWEEIPDKHEAEDKAEEDWKQFSTFLVQHELSRLEKLGIKYRLPPPGASFEGKRIKVRTALPGLPVQFSKDGGKTWNDVTESTEIDTKIILVTTSLDRQRMSRHIELQPP